MDIVRPCTSGPLRLKKIYRESIAKYAYDWRPQYPATSKKRPRSRSVSRSENVQSVRSDEAVSVVMIRNEPAVRPLQTHADVKETVPSMSDETVSHVYAKPIIHKAMVTSTLDCKCPTNETVQAVHARRIVRRLISSRFWRRTRSTPKREKLVKRVKSTDRKSEETWSLLWEGETSPPGPTQELRRGAIDEQYADQLAADAEAFFNLPDCDSDQSSWGES